MLLEVSSTFICDVDRPGGVQVSVFVFGDEFGPINVLGLFIVVAGVTIFNLIK